MKIKSLLLGSVAAAGLSTSAYAADLGVVLTSLDVCDSLGISGLTISSDTNCLKISGGVSYEFQWGSYKAVSNYWFGFPFQNAGVLGVDAGDAFLDWDSTVEAWLTFEGSADSSFGTAMASMTIEWSDTDSVSETNHTDWGSDFDITEAYVAIGDTTVLMAGMKGSIANYDDDEPFNFLGLFISDNVDAGVGGSSVLGRTGGHVIQVTSDLGNGLSVAAGLENLDGDADSSTTWDDGTFVGVLAYAGDGISAHATVVGGGILDGVIDTWGVHAGFTGEFDMFKIRGAAAVDSVGNWNVLGSAEATFDMFTLAVSAEAAEGEDYGVGASVSAAVTDGITINLGGRMFDANWAGPDTELYEGQAQIVAALTETLTATGTVGALYGSQPGPDYQVFYFDGELAWAPGGGFEAAIGAGANSANAYWVNFSASKDFE